MLIPETGPQAPTPPVAQPGLHIDPFAPFMGKPGIQTPPSSMPAGGWPTLSAPQGFDAPTPPPTQIPSGAQPDDSAYWRNLKVGDRVDPIVYANAFGGMPQDGSLAYNPNQGLVSGVGPDGKPLPQGDYYTRMAAALGNPGGADAYRTQANQWNQSQMNALTPPPAAPQDADPYGRNDDPAHPTHGIITPASEAAMGAQADLQSAPNAATTLPASLTSQINATESPSTSSALSAPMSDPGGWGTPYQPPTGITAGTPQGFEQPTPAPTSVPSTAAPTDPFAPFLSQQQPTQPVRGAAPTAQAIY